MEIMRKSSARKMNIKNRNKNRNLELQNNIFLDQIKKLADSFATIEKSLENMNKRIDRLTEAMDMHTKVLSEQRSEQLPIFRAKNEQLGELGERPLGISSAGEHLSMKSDGAKGRGNLGSIRGRHREILVMLINYGFHTYSQIAQKLGISQSRARAYIADLKNKFGLPLKQVRDPEGYKIGIDVRFVEEVLASK